MKNGLNQKKYDQMCDILEDFLSKACEECQKIVPEDFRAAPFMCILIGKALDMAYSTAPSLKAFEELLEMARDATLKNFRAIRKEE